MSGFTPDLMTSADDVFWFPNLVGPIYPGSALLFRVRPNGRDPHRVDQGHLGARVAAPERSSGRCRERRFYADWTERDWGEITEQDYANLANVQRGMRSRGFDGSAPQPSRRATSCTCTASIDRYLTAYRFA